jgi:hypothetical protein
MGVCYSCGESGGRELDWWGVEWGWWSGVEWRMGWSCGGGAGCVGEREWKGGGGLMGGRWGRVEGGGGREGGKGSGGVGDGWMVECEYWICVW